MSPYHYILVKKVLVKHSTEISDLMRVPNLHTALKRHLIKIFLKKIDSYLKKYIFTRRFEGLRLDQISCNFAQQ